MTPRAAACPSAVLAQADALDPAATRARHGRRSATARARVGRRRRVRDVLDRAARRHRRTGRGWHGAPVGPMSGGERRRVALAALLVADARPADARRADQPPRRRGRRLAGRAPGRPRRTGAAPRRRHPRPVVPRRGLHPAPGRSPTGTVAGVRGRLRRVRAGPGRARAGGGRHRGAPAEPAAQGDRLAAPRPAGPHHQAEVPHRRRQRADRRRAAGPRRRRAAAVRHHPARQAGRRPGGRHASHAGRPGAARPRHLAARARRPDRHRRRQRRRQDHAAAGARRRPCRSPAGAAQGRATRSGWRTCPRSCASSPEPTAGARGRRGGPPVRPARRQGDHRPPSSPSGSASPGRASGPGSATCPAASGAGCSCCGCCWPSPTCCCSTSPPTTSTSTRSPRWRTCSTPGPARCSWSPTTGTCSSGSPTGRSRCSATAGCATCPAASTSTCDLRARGARAVGGPAADAGGGIRCPSAPSGARGRCAGRRCRRPRSARPARSWPGSSGSWRGWRQREERLHAAMVANGDRPREGARAQRELREVVDEREALELEWLEAAEVVG